MFNLTATLSTIGVVILFVRTRSSSRRRKMRFKAVIFDIGGVLVRQPQLGIRKYEKELGTPPGFLGEIFMKGAPDNSFCQLERGELVFSEFLSKFDAEVENAAKIKNVELRGFNSSTLFDKMTNANEDILHRDMLSAVKELKKNQFKTCALTNNWIDDRDQNKSLRAKFMVNLRKFFDVVLESAVERIRKPDPRIYEMACQRLAIKPCEAIFLDDIGYNLKPAAELGITCIKVDNPTEAIKKLQGLVGIQLVKTEMTKHIYPPPVGPNDVPHAIAKLKSGIDLHYVEMGEGPVVILLHGFPDLWYSWRHQIPALASSGYRVIAIDQRGFGDSSVPYPVSEYSQDKLCQDVTDLMDVLGINQAAIVGHDWGGSVVWNLALSAPHRFTSVCAITTPLFTGEGYRRLMADMKTFDYQMYFREEGKAEKEFDSQLSRSFKLFFRGFDDEKIPYPGDKEIRRDLTNVRERGGFFVGFPEDIPKGHLITEHDLSYYVQQYGKTGFRGPLNLYRNSKYNRKFEQQFADRKIGIPALMITAANDYTLRPEFTIDMEDRIFKLDRCDLKRCNHWVHIERHDEVNDALIGWLNKLHKRQSKL